MEELMPNVIRDGYIDMFAVANQAQLIANKVFLEEYDKLSIVNPTKGKFQQTVLDQKYYDLIRIYANELERENTLLFVMGFSFADEHIRDLTIRVANSNPTLMIYIFAYTTDARGELEKVLDIENNVKNKNKQR
jgi:hypothetical protein